MAYKYRPINTKTFNSSVTENNYKSSHKYRSFGFYVLGGMDATGEHLEMNTPVTYDSEEDISNGCEVDSFTDPTVSFFDVAENLGADVAEQVAQASADKQ